ncbi:Ribonuclease H-like superfamily [Sesbania bispinosa]|nr:Ribonuclease H-like superfamily [Sesbania bispinosa]
MKLGWGMVDNPSALWMRLLRATYKAGSGSIPQMRRFSNEYIIWKSICKSWDFVLKGFYWRIGDGEATCFWTDCWLKSGRGLRDLLAQDLSDDRLNETVKDLSAEDGSWHLDRIAPWLFDDQLSHVSAHMRPIPISTWLQNHQAVCAHKIHSTKHISRSPPLEGWVKWNLDGSVIATGARTSSGCVLRDCMGRWLTGAVRNIGHSSITAAELWAFKDASYVSLLRGDTCVWFESDSVTAVNFVKNGVPLNHPCFGLVSAIRRDLSKIQNVFISHTFREGNFVADGLADIGHSFPLGLHFLPDPPTSISNSLLCWLIL